MINNRPSLFILDDIEYDERFRAIFNQIDNQITKLRVTQLLDPLPNQLAARPDIKNREQRRANGHVAQFKAELERSKFTKKRG